MTEQELRRTAVIIPPTGRAVLCVWAAVPGLFAAPFVFWQSVAAGAGFCLLWGFLVYCLWARACSFAAVLGTDRNGLLRRCAAGAAGASPPGRYQCPAAPDTPAAAGRRLAAHRGSPGREALLPAIPAQQAGLLAHILAEDAP